MTIPQAFICGAVIGIFLGGGAACLGVWVGMRKYRRLMVFIHGQKL